MNLPNKLTLFRLILVIPFIVLLSLAIAYSNGQIRFNHFGKSEIFYVVSGIVFAIAMSTDFLDGYIARKNNIVTDFGKLFDPVADKLITGSALIILSIGGIIPFWITLLFILRDIVVDGMRNLAAKNKHVVAASIWGKAKTMLLSIGMLIIFFVYPAIDFGTYDVSSWNWNIIWINLPIIGAAILSTYSGWEYFTKIKPYFNNDKIKMRGKDGK